MTNVSHMDIDVRRLTLVLEPKLLSRLLHIIGAATASLKLAREMTGLCRRKETTPSGISHNPCEEGQALSMQSKSRSLAVSRAQELPSLRVIVVMHHIGLGLVYEDTRVALVKILTMTVNVENYAHLPDHNVIQGKVRGLELISGDGDSCDFSAITAAISDDGYGNSEGNTDLIQSCSGPSEVELNWKKTKNLFSIDTKHLRLLYSHRSDSRLREGVQI